MRAATQLVFDDLISGSTTTWYSRPEFNMAIGVSDMFAVQAFVTSVTGTSPKLTVASQHSSDSQNWITTGLTEINNVAISSGNAYAGSNASVLGGGQVLANNIRLAISMTGTNPQCRLKLYVTARTM